MKAPKIYMRDTGILHSLLQLRGMAELESHPKLGASWEGFALEQALGMLATRDAYFWATHAGAELDLFVRLGGKQYGFEFNYADAPGASRSMHVAIQDLSLEHLWVVYPGRDEYRLQEKISVIPIDSLPRIADLLLSRRPSAANRSTGGEPASGVQ